MYPTYQIETSMETVLRQNQKGFGLGRSAGGQIIAIRRILEGVCAKNLSAVLLFVDFLKIR